MTRAVSPCDTNGEVMPDVLRTKEVVIESLGGDGPNWIVVSFKSIDSELP